MTIPPGQLSQDDASPAREPTPAEQAALQWVVRHDRGLTAEHERAFAAWLAADDRHRELFEEFGGTWELMRQAPAMPVAAAAAARPEKSPARARRALTHFWLPLAAAAALVIGYVQSTRRDPAREPMATEVGASRQLKLPDGSLVRLNTDSMVVADFTPAVRRVRLERGEAYFEVAKNPARPFIVEAAGVAVRAVGTAFNVRLRRDDVDVLVTEGTVRVAAAAAPADPSVPSPLPPAEVSANERMIVPLALVVTARPAPPPVAHMAAEEVARLLAWHDGRLDFSDTSLGEMVEEFNRYNRHKLAIADPALAAMRFGGSFRPDDREGFVRMLRERFGVQVEERANQTLLRAAR